MSDYHESDTVDFDALCARPSRSPASELRPFDWRTMIPPDPEPEGETTRAHRILGFVQQTSRQQRLLVLGGGAVVLLGLASLLAISGNAEAKSNPKPAVTMASPVAPALPPAPELHLPPPPTTGTAYSKTAPPRVVVKKVGNRP